MRRRALLSSLVPLSAAGCLRLTSGNPEGTETAEADRGTEAGLVDEEGDSESSDADETRTQEAAPDYPLGLSEDGVSSILVDTHALELSDRSFELDFSLQDPREGWDLSEQIIKDAERALQRHETREFERYYDGNVDGSSFWWRDQHRGRTLYGRANIGGKPHFANHEKATMADRLGAFVRVASYGEPTFDDEGAEPVFTVPAEEVDDADAFDERWHRDYDVRAVSATLTVDSDGIVRSLEGRFEATYEDSADHLLQFELTAANVGETTLPEPDWVETVRERGTEITVEAIGNDSVLAITHERGQEVPSDAKVSLVSPDRTRYETTLESAFAAGETRYVWMTDEGIVVSTSEPETDTRELTPEWHVRMKVGGGVYVEKGLDVVD